MPDITSPAWFLPSFALSLGVGLLLASGCDEETGRDGAVAATAGEDPGGPAGGKADENEGYELEVIVAHDVDERAPTACFMVDELESVRDNFASRLAFENGSMPALQNLALALREIRHYVRRRHDVSANGLTARDRLDCVVGGATVVFLGPAFGFTSPFRASYENSYLGGLFFRTQDAYGADPTVIERTTLSMDTKAYSNGICTEQWRDAFCDNTSNQIFHTWFFVALTYAAPEEDFASALTGFANAGHEWGIADDCWFNGEYSSGGCTVADWDASRWGAIYGMILRAAREDSESSAEGAFEQFVGLTAGMLADPAESEAVCNLANHYPIGDDAGLDIYGDPIVDTANCGAWVEMTNIVTDNFNAGMLGDFGTEMQRVGMHIVTSLQTISGFVSGVCCDTICGWVGACGN